MQSHEPRQNRPQLNARVLGGRRAKRVWFRAVLARDGWPRKKWLLPRPSVGSANAEEGFEAWLLRGCLSQAARPAASSVQGPGLHVRATKRKAGCVELGLADLVEWRERVGRRFGGNQSETQAACGAGEETGAVCLRVPVT